MTNHHQPPRPQESRPADEQQDGLQVSSRHYHETSGSLQAYNATTEWQLYKATCAEGCSGLGICHKWDSENIDALLPDTHLWFSEAAGKELGWEYPWLTLTEHMLDSSEGEFNRKWMGSLAKLPNSLLVATFTALYGKDKLQLTEDGRLRGRIYEWFDIHGALWPGEFRLGLEKRIRAAASVSRIMVAAAA